jgi:GntR family transcriptional regulator
MIYLAVDLQSADPPYLQIIEQVKRLVRAGTLKPGTPLPPVRQLAVELSINPNTVAKAYLLLEREGILRTMRRRGSFVAEAARDKAREAVTQRVDDALDRLVRQAEELGMDREELLTAIKRKLEEGQESKGKKGGQSG